MWWPFKNKFNKLTREEVVEAVIDLEKQLEKLENGIVEKQNKIDIIVDKITNASSQEIDRLMEKLLDVSHK